MLPPAQMDVELLFGAEGSCKVTAIANKTGPERYALQCTAKSQGLVFSSRIQTRSNVLINNHYVEVDRTPSHQVTSHCFPLWDMLF
jgi:hypothetical protein